MKRILFSGGGGAGNEALWKLLSNKYDLYFADANLKSINPIIPENKRVLLPWASDNNFLEKIIVICRDLKIDIFVPGVDEELLLLAKFKDKLLPTILYLPDSSYIEMMIDKFRMINNLKQAGITVPLTKKFSEGFDGISFPCIAKPIHGRGSRGVITLFNRQEAEIFKKYIDVKNEDYIYQNKIEGDEYTVQMIANNMNILKAIIPVKVGTKKGITIDAVTTRDDNVIISCMNIHDKYPAKGCYNIQLILTDQGEVYPFEINPRISTTFCMTVATGIDPFDLYLDNNDMSEPIIPESSIRLQRFWANYFTARV